MERKIVVVNAATGATQEMTEQEAKEIFLKSKPAVFTPDADELEVLALHYFEVRLGFEYEQFAYPDDIPGSSEMRVYERSIPRLDAIATILGDEKMELLRQTAETSFKATLGYDNWAAFAALGYAIRTSKEEPTPTSIEEL
jgi:hypothetical protein